jgi:propanol-preferring alcohol dehydrogenase
MKAMVLQAFNQPMELQELPMPKPTPRDVVVRVHACGSGLTLHHSATGNLPTDLPVVLGHEIAGEVVEVGSAAEGLSLGDIVTPHALLHCGRCRYCLTMREPLCDTPGMIGRQVNGGYAEYVAAPDRNWIKLPRSLLDDYDPASACVICDAMATPFKVARRAGLAANETCVIIGAAGGVGIHMIGIARMCGARVIGVDLGDDKLAAASDQGAHELIDATGRDVASEILRITDGRGADVVTDFVGSSDTLDAGARSLARGGRLVIIGVSRASEARVAAEATNMVRAEQSILGSRSFTSQEIVDTLDLVARGILQPVVNHVFPLEQANEAHALVASGRNIGRVVLSVADPG